MPIRDLPRQRPDKIEKELPINPRLLEDSVDCYEPGED